MTVAGNIAYPLAGCAGSAKAEIAERVQKRARARAARRARRAQRRPALGRPAPARRARPRHRLRAAHPADGRAAVGARQEAARADADRGAPPASAPRHDDGLRHARPARGADHVGPHRGDRQGPLPADRQARAISTSARQAASSPSSSANRISCRFQVRGGDRALPGQAAEAGGAAAPCVAATQFLVMRPEKLEARRPADGAMASTCSRATAQEIVYQGESTLLYVDAARRRRGRDPPAGRQVPGAALPPPGAPVRLGLAAGRHDPGAGRARAMTTAGLADEDGRRDPRGSQGTERGRRAARRSAARQRCWRRSPCRRSLLIGAIALAPIAWLFWLSFRSS